MFRITLFVLLVATSAAVPAATLIVDTGSDLALSDCDDGISADCSLRGAIEKANLSSIEDTIHFAIPESDPSYQAATAHWQISVDATSLPAFEAPVVIDGYSQAGAVANTNTPDDGGLNGGLKIELRAVATGANAQSGLETSLNFFSQGASTIRGLAISGFGNQIALSGSAAHRIEGCYLGTTVNGNAAASVGGTVGVGVRLYGPGNYIIGGRQPEERNLISGMRTAIFGLSALDGIEVLGNLIGTDASGVSAIGHSDYAALSFGNGITNAHIGGIDSAARNLISGNRIGAIDLSYSGGPNPFAGVRIEGNYIGTDVTGTRALPNGDLGSQTRAAITVFGANSCALEIGGSAPGAANLIAFNAGAGIQVSQCEGVLAYGNQFSGNAIGIDLSVTSNADGATSNDAGDGDNGGNQMQNSPVITLPPGFLVSGGTSVALSYVVDSAPANSSFPLTVYFYRAGCNGGGRELVASDTYGEADAQLARNFQIDTDANVLPLTALAVDAAGNTSEFSTMLGDELFVDGFEDSPGVFSAGQCR